MSRQTLLQYLSNNGKDMSWEQLATIHKIKNSEAARSIWKTYRFNNPTAKEPSLQEALTEFRNTMIKAHKVVEYSKATLKKLTSVKEHMVEISFPDLHIGKLAWDKETGEDYDITIAIERAKQAIRELVSRLVVSQVDRILLPLGNDLISVDNKMGTTTMGTPQSADGRFGKMFKATKDLVIDTISILNKIAPVDVLIIPGNHDESTMFTLGEVLDAWYKDDKNVQIYNSPKLRKYYQYGKNMIGFTHGDKEKHQELGLVMASEEPLMWGSSNHREFHLGHFHKSKTTQYTTGDEFPGFKIRILPSLSSADAWHYAQGYLSAKAAKAFIWHKDKGLITEHTYNI